MDSETEIREGTKRERTRDRLLASAQSLLLEKTAAGLGIRQITSHSGLVHTSFYNYYPDIPALLSDLSALYGATHLAAITKLDLDNAPPGGRLARITRQTLRILSQQSEFGRLIFDIGLPVDFLESKLRLQLKSDLARVVESGLYKVADIDVAVSVAAGSVTGLALDIHRGLLSPHKIDIATAQILLNLGIAPALAEVAAHEPVVFPPPPAFPMRWLALPAMFRPDDHH